MRLSCRTGSGLLFLAALLATACSRAPAPAGAPPVVAPLAAASTAGPASETPGDEISRFRAAAEALPTADHYSDLSWILLKAGRYQEAEAAADQALKLKFDHPYALYNSGMAKLALGKNCGAEASLKRSAALQPNRPEPILGLAQAYKAIGAHSLAVYTAAQATRLGAGEGQGLLDGLAAATGAPPPTDLEQASVAKGTGWGNQLYIYPQKAPDCNEARPYTLYLKDGATQTVVSLPVWVPMHGEVGLRVAEGRTPAASIPGGYWIQGGYVGAGVANTFAWHLVTYRDGKLAEVIFRGAHDWPMGGFADYIRSPGQPSISDSVIHVGHRDDATGSRELFQSWRLNLAEATADLESERGTWNGEVVSATGSGLSLKWSYNQKVLSFAFAPTVQVLLPGGRQGSPADLKPGMSIQIIERAGSVEVVSVMR